MSRDPDDLFDEVHALLTAHFEGRLDDEGYARLQHLLETEPEGRRVYLEYVAQTASLRWWAGTVAKTTDPPPDAEDPPLTPAESLRNTDAMILPAVRLDEPAATGAEARAAAPPAPVGLPTARVPGFVRRWATWRRAAVVLLPLMLGLGVYRLTRSPGPAATLSAAVDAQWDPAGQVPRPGQPLTAAPLYLKAGVADVRFASGVSLILEGPARLTIRSGKAVDLRSGRLTATIPAAGRGFAVGTPTAEVVDLGTEFGVDVAADGATHAEVFRGTAEARALSGSAKLSLTAGRGAGVAAGGGPVLPEPPRPEAFVRADEFAARRASPGSPYHRWLAHTFRLRRDPTLVAYYTFDNGRETPDRLVNRSAAGAALDGSLDAVAGQAPPAWASGRWPEKGALAFDGQPGQRVTVPATPDLDFSRGEQTARPITVIAWLDAVPRSAAGSIACRGEAEHEQFALDLIGGYRAWVRDVPSPDSSTTAASGVRPDGQWNCVASVYDPVRGTVVLYLNGNEIARASNAPHTLLRTDAPLDIGSRPAKGASWFPSVQGRIDELAILGRTLSAEEVREMYERGRPG